MLFCALILLGIVSLTKLNVDLLPEIEPPVVSILTAWPGASASDVETEVTEIIENQVNSVNNLDTLTSKSLDNLSVISCKFDWGTNLDVATNDVRDKLELTKRDLPDDVDPPMLFKFSSATMPIMAITISGELTWPRLYHIVDKKISDELKRVPGVGAIVDYGGLRRRINVYFDMKKLEGFNLSMQQVNHVLDRENMNVPAGSIKSGYGDYFVRVPARYKGMGEIRDTIIGYYDERPVYLRDVADVQDAYEPEDLNAWGDGKKAVLLLLQKQTGKNTVAVVHKVKKRLAEIQKGLPSDVKIEIPFDTAEYILLAIKNLRNTLLWGIFFVVLVTVAFLRSIRTAVIISLTIPFSLIISFIFLYIFGYTINTISLISLIVASGMVVDNGIVVLENIVHHIERGGRVRASAISGSGEMGLAVTASTLTIVAVFVPLVFITGLTGIMFKQLSVVISVTLLASLFTALSMVPMLSSKWVTPAHETAKARWQVGSEKGFEMVEGGYDRLLGWSLGHRKTVILLAVAVFASSLSLIPFLSTAFVPEPDSGDVDIKFRLQEGTRIEETNRTIERILKIMDEIVKPEEYRNSYAFDGESEEGMGVALGFDEGPNVGEIGFKLVDRDKRDRSAKEIANLLRERIAEIPGVCRLQVTSTSPVKSMMMGAGKPVSVEVLGADLDADIAFARRLAKVVKTIPGAMDVALSQKDTRPELWVEIDRAKASSLGLSVAAIAGTVRNYFYGMEATEFRDAGDDYDIFTRFREEDKNRLDTLPLIPVFTPDGRMIRLKNVARIVDGEGPIEIQRKNRQKIVKVEADTFGRPLGDVTADIKTELKKMGIPEGISISFGADVEEQQKAFRDLGMLLLLGIILVYMTLASLYGNFRDPLIIMFSVPFAASGVFYAFYFGGISLDIFTFMGIIMLEGIVVKNAIVLLDYTHLLQKRGEPVFEAVTHAGRNRLRPILMTTLTTIFAMLPMALSRSVGAEIWNALGITIISGLSVSTLVTLILIPTVYYMFEKRKEEKRSLNVEIGN